ncbi:uncharacterized protein [Nicotiana tomentosiformis]|uniref:uncharacterized protein n=1 Tax=Nicotiana tomentosiformis TaxID=4098 RepID=UPI00388C5899
MKGVMMIGKKGKLSPRHIGLFEVLERIGEVAYKLELMPSLSIVHLVFYVFMLRKYYGDPSCVLDFRMVQLDRDLTYDVELMAIFGSVGLKVEIKEYSFSKSIVEKSASQGGYLGYRTGDAEQLSTPI